MINAVFFLTASLITASFVKFPYYLPYALTELLIFMSLLSCATNFSYTEIIRVQEMAEQRAKDTQEQHEEDMRYAKFLEFGMMLCNQEYSPDRIDAMDGHHASFNPPHTPNPPSPLNDETRGSFHTLRSGRRY